MRRNPQCGDSRCACADWDEEDVAHEMNAQDPEYVADEEVST